jgi:hypothetical protein
MNAAIIAMKRRVIWIFILFLVLRLLFAFRLPIFNDEGTYMRWAMGFVRSPSHWWAWMLDGKQPLVAITFGIFTLLPFDPLILMRLSSILWSCVTFWAVFIIVRRLCIQNKITHCSLFIDYCLFFISVCPYLIVFDTLAIAESPVNACFTLTLLLTLLFVEKPTYLKGIAIGMAIALGWWYKSTILLVIPLIIGTLLLNIKSWKTQWQIVVTSAVSSVCIGILIASPVIWNPYIDFQSTAVIPRTVPLVKIVTFPFAQWASDASNMFQSLVGYIGPCICVLFGIAIWKLWKIKTVRVLFGWAVMPIVLEIVMLTSFSARYLIYITVPVILLAGWILIKLSNGIRLAILSISIFIAFIAAWSPLAYYRLLTPLPYAHTDFGQYVTGWTSGYGVQEAIHVLVKQSETKQIITFIRFDGGNPEDAVLSYMQRARIPAAHVSQIDAVAKHPTLSRFPWYFVSRGTQLAGLENRLTLIAKFPKPTGDEFVGVYEIKK